MSVLELENQLRLQLEETPLEEASDDDFYWMHRVSELLPELRRLRLLVIDRDRDAGRSWEQIAKSLGMEPSHVEDLARRAAVSTGRENEQ